MADSPPVANRWSFFTTLATSLIAALPVIAALLVGSAGTVGLQKLTAPAPLKIAAADPPKPTPIACAQDFHDLEGKVKLAAVEIGQVRSDIAALRALAEQRFPAAKVPRAVPSKTTKGFFQ